jgi:hypothetical protein
MVTQTERTSSLAKAALACGIIQLFGLFPIGIVAVVLGQSRADAPPPASAIRRVLRWQPATYKQAWLFAPVAGLTCMAGVYFGYGHDAWGRIGERSVRHSR